jgi:hypothetical protein
VHDLDTITPCTQASAVKPGPRTREHLSSDIDAPLAQLSRARHALFTTSKPARRTPRQALESEHDRPAQDASVRAHARNGIHLADDSTLASSPATPRDVSLGVALSRALSLHLGPTLFLLFPAQHLAPETLARAETLPHRPATQWRAYGLMHRCDPPSPPCTRLWL